MGVMSAPGRPQPCGVSMRASEPRLHLSRYTACLRTSAAYQSQDHREKSLPSHTVCAAGCQIRQHCASRKLSRSRHCPGPCLMQHSAHLPCGGTSRPGSHPATAGAANGPAHCRGRRAESDPGSLAESDSCSRTEHDAGARGRARHRARALTDARADHRPRADPYTGSCP